MPVRRRIMLENCRWVLYASRLYGCHPHTIRQRLAPAHFRALVLYSMIACCTYATMSYHASGTVSCVPVNAMIVGCALQRIDRYVRGFYMILTTLLSCLRSARFESAVVAVRRFDALTRRRRRDGDDECTNRRAQWLTILGLHAAWFIFCSCGIISQETYWSTIALQSIMRCALSIQVAKVCFLYDALRRRFRRLNEMCRGRIRDGAAAGVSNGKFGVHGERLTLPNLQRMHECLTDATNDLTSHYSPQLLFWISCFLIDILTFIFFALYRANTVMYFSIQCILSLFLSLQIIAISRMCHLTCDQANAFARIVLSVETASEVSIEATELGVYHRTHPLCISVFGLFNLNSYFAFSAFSVMLMYVILASSLH